TGGHLDIGQASLWLLPSPGFSADGVTLSDAPWNAPAPMLSSGSSRVGSPCCRSSPGHLAFDEMDIEQPMVSLAVRPDGRRNWVLRKSAAAEPAHEQAQMPAPSSAPIPPRRRLGGSGAGDSAAAPYAPASAPRSSALRQYFRRTY